MTVMQWVFLALLFGAVFGAVLLAFRLLTPSAVQNRLDTVAGAKGAATGKVGATLMAHVINLTNPLAKLSVPDEDWESSALRLRFIKAGLRAPSAPGLFFAAKSGLTVGLPLLTYTLLSGRSGESDFTILLFWLLSAAASGYYLPDFIMKQLTARRQREIFETFPDALDLMTVCVEAGLALDAALARVATEIGLKSTILAEELQLVTLELRAGSAKDRALRNLALRTGIDDVDALVTMLIQAERFGTSIAASLRVQSDQLRTKRRQRAEEQAAKIALKLLFPLIFFIFPCLLIVLMGPAFIQIYRVLLPSMGGGL